MKPPSWRLRIRAAWYCLLGRPVLLHWYLCGAEIAPLRQPALSGACILDGCIEHPAIDLPPLIAAEVERLEQMRA